MINMFQFGGRLMIKMNFMQIEKRCIKKIKNIRLIVHSNYQLWMK